MLVASMFVSLGAPWQLLQPSGITKEAASSLPSGSFPHQRRAHHQPTSHRGRLRVSPNSMTAPNQVTDTQPLLKQTWYECSDPL